MKKTDGGAGTLWKAELAAAALDSLYTNSFPEATILGVAELGATGQLKMHATWHGQGRAQVMHVRSAVKPLFQAMIGKMSGTEFLFDNEIQNLVLELEVHRSEPHACHIVAYDPNVSLFLLTLANQPALPITVYLITYLLHGTPLAIY